jgi:hypothetical protein
MVRKLAVCGKEDGGMMRRISMVIACVALAGCSYEEIEREIGYKGRARVNPWLAAERFAEASGFEVVSSGSWLEPEWRDSVWFVPGMLVSNQLFTRKLDEWMDDGGHLVLLLENAESETNDWRFASSTPPVIEPPLRTMIEKAGIEISEDKPRTLTNAGYRGKTFTVDANPRTRVKSGAAAEPGLIASVEYGGGRLTVVADARIFRNRWISEEEHAALLTAILNDADKQWRAGFMRGSGLSFWNLLGTHLWPVLVALGAWMVFWLWRCFGRFGPLESADEPNNLRGYDHHLEALGGFHWEIDHATALLAPLRARIAEHGHHLCARAGRPEPEFLDFLAERAGLPRDHVARAMAATPPKDAASLTLITADLQKIIHTLT